MAAKGNARISPYAHKGESPTREQIVDAIARFLRSGGKIQRLKGANVGGVSIDGKGRFVGAPQTLVIAGDMLKPTTGWDDFAIASLAGPGALYNKREKGKR